MQESGLGLENILHLVLGEHSVPESMEVHVWQYKQWGRILKKEL